MTKLILLITFFAAACFSYAQTIPLSSQNRKAIDHYHQGWDLVMNKGNYAASEAAFQEAFELDTGFVLGATLLYRISTNAQEKQQLYALVTENLDSIPNPDEKRLAQLYLKLGSGEIDDWDVALLQFDSLVTKYPEERYLFAEYIELINKTQGPKTAIDSLQNLAKQQHHIMPFIMAYKVSLYSAIGALDVASIYLNQLENAFAHHDQIPRVLLAKAELALAKNQHKVAQKYLDQVLAIDPKNLDVNRLLKKHK